MTKAYWPPATESVARELAEEMGLADLRERYDSWTALCRDHEISLPRARTMTREPMESTNADFFKKHGLIDPRLINRFWEPIDFSNLLGQWRCWAGTSSGWIYVESIFDITGVRERKF